MGLLGNGPTRKSSGGLLDSYMPMFEAASARTGIPVQILMAQAMQESGGNPNAVGRAGEVGLMQIMPSTAKQPGYGVNPVDVASLSDPATNINFAADYLAGRGKSAGVKDWNDPAQMALALKNYNGGGDPNYVQNVYQHLPKFAGGEASGDMLGGEGNDPFSRAKAAGMPDWFNGSPEAYLKNASATPQKASGGGNSFLGGLGQFFGDNSDALMGAGLALMSGPASEAIPLAIQAMNEGSDRDFRRKQMGREQSAAESIAKQYPEFADMIRANPQLAQGIVAAQINNRMESKVPQYTYQQGPDGSIIAINKNNPNDMKTVVQGAPKTTDDQKEYEAAKAQGFDGTFFDYQTALKKAGASSVNTSPGPAKQVFDTVAGRADEARSAAAALPAFAEASTALGSGNIILGAGADLRLGLSKIGSYFGLDPSAAENTETFRAAMAPVVLGLVKGLGAGTAISNADREFAEKAAAGNISLEPGSIARLIDIGKRAAEYKVNQHNKMIDQVYPDGAPENGQVRSLFRVDVPQYQAPQAQPQPSASQPPPAKRLKFNPQTGELE